VIVINSKQTMINAPHRQQPNYILFEYLSTSEYVTNHI